MSTVATPDIVPAEPDAQPSEMSTEQIFQAEAGTEVTTPVEEETTAAPPVEPEPDPEKATIAEDDLMKLVDEQFGGNFASKYKTDDDFLKGVVEAQKMIGHRDVDAEYGRQMRQYEPYLQQYMTQQQTPEPEKPAQQPQLTYDQAKILANQVRQNPETGELEPVPGAPPGAVGQLQEHSERIRRAAHDMAYNPEQYIDSLVEQRMEQVPQYVQQTVSKAEADTRSRMESETWIDSNKQWLFNGGDQANGFTATGNTFLTEYYNRLKPQVDVGLKSNRQVLEESFDMFRQTVPAAPPGPAPQAQHKPPVATPQAQGVTPGPPEMRDDETTFDFIKRAQEYAMTHE